MSKDNRYVKIIERIFLDRYRDGMREVSFSREDLVETARILDIKLPKNLGDLIYTFRYRGILPQTILEKAPPGESWIIRPAGRSQYCFALSNQPAIVPNPLMAETKIPDATPGIIEKYAFNDEQALLAKLRYNRLIDVFTGVTCYSLQNHLRTTVAGMGQVETDELYVGLDRRGAHYVIPVQAKGGTDRLSVVQIEQDVALCEAKFPNLICRPIAAQFLQENVIVLFEFVRDQDAIKLASERHFRLVPPAQVSNEDLERYRRGAE